MTWLALGLTATLLVPSSAGLAWSATSSVASTSIAASVAPTPEPEPVATSTPQPEPTPQPPPDSPPESAPAEPAGLSPDVLRLVLTLGLVLCVHTLLLTVIAVRLLTR